MVNLFALLSWIPLSHFFTLFNFNYLNLHNHCYYSLNFHWYYQCVVLNHRSFIVNRVLHFTQINGLTIHFFGLILINVQPFFIISHDINQDISQSNSSKDCAQIPYNYYLHFIIIALSLYHYCCYWLNYLQVLHYCGLALSDLYIDFGNFMLNLRKVLSTKPVDHSSVLISLQSILLLTGLWICYEVLGNFWL